MNYEIRIAAQRQPDNYDAIIMAVAYEQFVAMGVEGMRTFGKVESVAYAAKYVLPRIAANGRL